MTASSERKERVAKALEKLREAENALFLVGDRVRVNNASIEAGAIRVRPDGIIVGVDLPNARLVIRFPGDVFETWCMGDAEVIE